MAENERFAAPVFQALTVGDRAFIGMDTYTDPNKLQDGFCQRITNLVSQNGSLVPRKGFQCQTSTARSGSYWASTSVRSAKNVASSAVLVAESNGSLDAGFWKFDALHNNALPIPMSASGTLTFSNIEPDRVRMAQFGRYVYVAPGIAASGTDNYPLRIDTNTKSQKLTSVVLGTNKFTLASHGLSVADPIVITAVTSGTLPGALSLNGVYYVTRVDGNDFYVAASLPTTTTTTVSHITWTAPSPTCQVTIVTTFKGETIPVVTGLPDISPVPEAWPFIAKAIPTSNVYSLVTNSVTLSSSSQMLLTSTFSGSDNASPSNWTQFNSKTVTVKTQAANTGLPRPSAGELILIDDSSDGGVYPGIWQEVTPVTETTTLYSGTSTTPCLMYRLSVRLCHFDQATTPRRRPVTIRVKATKLSGGSQVAIDGATVQEFVNLEPNNKNRDLFSTVDIIADFRDFKDEIKTTGKIRVEIQAAADFGTVSGNEGLYVDYMYLYPHVAVPSTSTTDTAVDTDTKLVRVRATSINTNTLDYAGFVRDRHFYYNITSSPTVNFTLTSAVVTMNTGTLPENGTPVSFASVGTTNLTAGQTYFVVNSSGTTFGLSSTYNGTALTIGGTSGTLTNITMTTGMYFKNTEYISCQYYLPPAFDTQSPQFSIGIQSGSMSTVAWGGKGAVDTINRYLTFDLSVFQKSDLENVKAVYIRCDDDFLVSNLPDSASVINNTILFYVGQLVYNGELQNQGTYEYAFTRWKAAPSYDTITNTAQISFQAIAPWTYSSNASTYFGGVESALSKTSVPLRTSNAESRIRLLLSASDFKDSSGQGYTHLLVYRRNNTGFPDGKFRCVAQVNISGATPSLSSSSANIKLESTSTSTNIVLIDNVGDTELLFDKPLGQTGYVYRDGKDFIPQGCETIAVHQQRLWMSKSNTVFASWLLDNDNEYALHTTIVPIATDPYLPIKGASFDISGQNDYEPIMAMVPFSGEGLSKNNSTSNALLILRNNSILPIVGSDASTFSVLGFVREPGAGCVAPLCAQTVLGRVWWLSNSGINQYANGLPTTMSRMLDRLINARSNNPLYNATSGNMVVNQSLQRTSCSVLFDNKFIFASAQPGSTYVNTLFVFDPSVNGWFEWSFPQPSTGSATQPRSMFVFNSDFDAPELFVAGSNGHIYKYTGSQDMHTTTLESFPWAVLTRQYGQTYAQGQAYYAQNRVSQLDIHVETTSSLNMTWRVYNQTQPQLVSPVFNNPTFTFYSSGVWAFSAGNKSVAVRNIMKDMRGTSYSVQLSGTSLADGNWFRIYGVLLHVSEGGIRRLS